MPSENITRLQPTAVVAENPGRNAWILPGLILAGAAALRVAGLDKSLWIDEVGSYVLATSPDFVASARADVHPPLYNALLRLGTMLTDSVPLLRLFSVGCGLLTLALFLRLRPRAAGLVAAVLLGCSPEMIYHAQELRPYALLNLLLAAALLATLHLLEHPDSRPARRWLLVTSVLAACTHLVAGFFLAALGATLLLFQNRLPWIQRLRNTGLLLPAGLCLLLFRFVFLNQASAITGNWWAGEFSLRGASGEFANASGWASLDWLARAAGRHLPAVELILLFLAAAGLGLLGWAAWAHKNRLARAALLVAAVYWGCLALYSWQRVNIALARLILPGMLPLIASIALGLSTQPRPRLRRAAIATATVLALLATMPWLRQFAWQPREDLRGFTGMLRQVHQSGDVLVFLGETHAPRYYWPDYETETLPLIISLESPWPDALETLERKISQHAPGASVTVIYRDDGNFRRHADLWREIETRLLAQGRREESAWNRDYYHIVRFAPPPVRP